MCENYVEHQFEDDPREFRGTVWGYAHYRTRRICQVCGLVDWTHAFIHDAHDPYWLIEQAKRRAQERRRVQVEEKKHE